MRVRTKKNLSKRISKCEYLLVYEAEKNKGHWNDIFTNNAANTPLHLEIGCGKGTFIYEMAKKHPDINFIAIERVENVIISALEKVNNEGLTNIRFICNNARNLNEYFAENELHRIYLNFSDPWPKKGYVKNRLTHPIFLEVYKSLLISQGEIHQKTDNRLLFDFSLVSFQQCGFSLKNVTYDLHNSGYTENIVTEYEERFSSMGMPIHRLEAISPIKTNI